MSRRGSSIFATAQLLGVELRPWQARGARIGLSRRRDRWRYPVVVVTVPRQAGKTRLDQIVAVDRCLGQPGAQVYYTAQSRMDAVLRWRELVRLLRRSPLIESHASFGRRSTGWDYVTRSAIGTEEIEFANGSQLRVFAPAEDSLHGSVTDLVILDEARFFDARHGEGLIGAALPTQATRDGQVWITSTAGDASSMFLAGMLEQARAQLDDPDARVALVDYGIPDGPALEGPALLEAVWRSHPSAGLDGGLVLDALEVAAASMSPQQFAHEYGNRWITTADVRLIPASLWEATETLEELPTSSPPCFAADVAPDRSEATIVACVDGVLEVVDHRAGALWVAERLLDLARTWSSPRCAVDAAGPAGTVADQLRPVLEQLLVTSTRDLQVACGLFVDGLEAGTVRHRPSIVLDAAAAAATRRQLGQSWVFSRLDGGTVLIAAALAYWAQTRVVDTLEEPAIF